VKPAVLVNGVPVAVQFSAVAPGFVGLYQVNAQIPAAAASGAATLQFTVNGRASNTVNIAIK
jgi:uncharacterized protein (TIGR03437 family)